MTMMMMMMIPSEEKLTDIRIKTSNDEFLRILT